MKQLFTILLLLNFGPVVADESSDTTRAYIKQMLTEKTFWRWDGTTQELGLCFKVPNQPDLCAKVPPRYMVRAVEAVPGI